MQRKSKQQKVNQKLITPIHNHHIEPNKDNQVEEFLRTTISADIQRIKDEIQTYVIKSGGTTANQVLSLKISILEKKKEDLEQCVVALQLQNQAQHISQIEDKERLERLLDVVRQTKSDHDDEIRRLKGEIDILERSESQLKHSQEALEADLKDCMKQSVEKDDLIKILKKEAEVIQDKELVLTKACDTLETKISCLESENDLCAKSLIAKEVEMKELQEHKDMLLTRMGELNSELLTKTQELKSMEEENGLLLKDKENYRLLVEEMKYSENQANENLIKTLEVKDDNINELCQRIKFLETDLKSLNSELKDYHTNSKDKDIQIENQKSIIKDLEVKFRSKISDYHRLSKAFAEAEKERIEEITTMNKKTSVEKETQTEATSVAVISKDTLSESKNVEKNKIENCVDYFIERLATNTLVISNCKKSVNEIKSMLKVSKFVTVVKNWVDCERSMCWVTYGSRKEAIHAFIEIEKLNIGMKPAFSTSSELDRMKKEFYCMKQSSSSFPNQRFASSFSGSIQFNPWTGGGNFPLNNYYPYVHPNNYGNY